MRLLLLLFYVIITQAVKDDWIDPHEIKLNSNAKKKLKRSMSEHDKDQFLNVNPIVKENESNTTPTVEESTSLTYLKRAVNLIINSANAEKGDPSVYTGSFSFKTNTEEFSFLTDFSKKALVSVEDIRRLDSILSEVFSKSNEYNFISINISKEEVFTALFRLDVLIIFGITVCLLVMYYLLKNKYGFFYILSYFTFLILIVDYAVRYKFLYEEAEEHNLKLLYSKDCDVAKMSWTEYLKFVLSHKDCERKIVTPLDVGLNQLKYIIIIPLESFGTGMGLFGKELWGILECIRFYILQTVLLVKEALSNCTWHMAFISKKLPFPWNILIFPIMLIFIVLMVFFFTIAFRDSPFKLNIMHLFKLEFGKQHDDRNRISGKTLDTFLEATTLHRPLLENARSSPENKIKKNKNKRNRNKSLPEYVKSDGTKESIKERDTKNDEVPKGRQFGIEEAIS